MSDRMDMTPPPPPPIPITRDYADVGGLRPDPATPSNVLIQNMPEPLRSLFGNTQIRRPSEAEFQSHVPDGFSAGHEGQWLAGYYNGPTDQVMIRRGAENMGDIYSMAEHELLHRLAATYPKYQVDGRGYYPQLMGLLFRNDQQALDRWVGDPGHAFTTYGAQALHDPSALPDYLHSYFAPLLPTVQPRRGPF